MAWEVLLHSPMPRAVVLALLFAAIAAPASAASRRALEGPAKGALDFERRQARKVKTAASSLPGGLRQVPHLVSKQLRAAMLRSTSIETRSVGSTSIGDGAVDSSIDVSTPEGRALFTSSHRLDFARQNLRTARRGDGLFSAETETMWGLHAGSPFLYLKVAGGLGEPIDSQSALYFPKTTLLPSGDLVPPQSWVTESQVTARHGATPTRRYQVWQWQSSGSQLRRRVASPVRDERDRDFLGRLLDPILGTSR